MLEAHVVTKNVLSPLNFLLFELFMIRVTKCDFSKYGPSGTIEKQDAFCVLPQNIVNEKIFVVLWVWFIALAVTSSVCFAITVSNLSIASRKIKLIQVS